MNIDINNLYNSLSKSLLNKGISLETLSIREYGSTFYIEVTSYKNNRLIKLINPKIEYECIQNSLKESLSTIEFDYFDNFDNYFIFEVKKLGI